MKVQETLLQTEEEAVATDPIWGRILRQCPRCHATHSVGAAHASCGGCGYQYEDVLMWLDRVYVEVNALGGTPVNGPYNVAIGAVLDVLRRLGAVDVETQRR